MRFRSKRGALWGYFASTAPERHHILTCTVEGFGHVALPVDPDERAWLRKRLAEADEGRPDPEQPETPTEGLARLMLDILEAHDELGFDEDDPFIEKANALLAEMEERSAHPYNGGL